jgi:hypothetical protein
MHTREWKEEGEGFIIPPLLQAQFSKNSARRKAKAGTFQALLYFQPPYFQPIIPISRATSIYSSE